MQIIYYDDLLAVKKVAEQHFVTRQEEIGKLVLLTIFTDTTMAKELQAQLLKHQVIVVYSIYLTQTFMY